MHFRWCFGRRDNNVQKHKGSLVTSAEAGGTSRHRVIVEWIGNSQFASRTQNAQNVVLRGKLLLRVRADCGTPFVHRTSAVTRENDYDNDTQISTWQIPNRELRFTVRGKPRHPTRSSIGAFPDLRGLVRLLQPCAIEQRIAR